MDEDRSATPGLGLCCSLNYLYALPVGSVWTGRKLLDALRVLQDLDVAGPTVPHQGSVRVKSRPLLGRGPLSSLGLRCSRDHSSTNHIRGSTLCFRFFCGSSRLFWAVLWLWLRLACVLGRRGISLSSRLRISGCGKRLTLILQELYEERLDLLLSLPHLGGELLPDFLEPKTMRNCRHSASSIRLCHKYGLTVFAEEGRVWKDAFAPLYIARWCNHELDELQERRCVPRATIKLPVSRSVDLVKMALRDLERTDGALAVKEWACVKLSPSCSQCCSFSHHL